MSASSAAPTRVASEFAIHIDGVTKRFGRIIAVDDLSLTVAPGEEFGFLGPNGAGESSTIRILPGLIHPTAGTAHAFGDAAGDVLQAHRTVAYVPADVALWRALTGAEILELLGNVGPGIDIEYRAELVDRFDLDLDRPGKTYSSGNRQKVALVAAFATRAPLLVFDEPTSGLDPLMELEFRRCVSQARERGQTVYRRVLPSRRRPDRVDSRILRRKPPVRRARRHRRPQHGEWVRCACHLGGSGDYWCPFWDRGGTGRLVEHRTDRVACTRSGRISTWPLPSVVGPIGALPVVGGFLLNVITQGKWAPNWLVNLSPFNHVAAVPRTPPNWSGVVALAVIGAILIAMGVAGYSRRDLIT